MQEKISQNANFIINRLKSALNFKTDLDLAEFFGVKPSTLSTWRARNSVNYDLIFANCSDLDLNWIIYGNLRNLPGEKKTPVIKINKNALQALHGIPYYDILPVSAGDFSALLNHEKPTSFINIPQLIDCMAAFPVFGTSMKGVIEPGDIIVVKEINNRMEFDPSLPYMIITDENRMIKFLSIDEIDNNIIWADSPNHSRVRISIENIKMVYAIKCVIRYY